MTPLEWENRFFAVNSAIVRFDEHAPRLTPEALAGWSRVQAKIAASDTVRLDALQRLGFQLVEGEVDLALPVGSPADAGADVAVEADIAPLREQAAQAFAMSRFRAPGTLPIDVQLRTSEHRSMYSYVRLSIDRCTATYV